MRIGENVEVKVKDEVRGYYTNPETRGEVMDFDDEHILIRPWSGSPDRYVIWDCEYIRSI